MQDSHSNPPPPPLVQRGPPAEAPPSPPAVPPRPGFDPEVVADEVAQEPVADRLIFGMPPWARQWTSAMVSVVVHSLLVTGFGLWAYGFRGAPTPGGEEVMIAELPVIELEDETPELQPEAEQGQQPSEMELMEVAPLSISEAGQLELVDVASSLGVGGQGAINTGEVRESGMAAQASFMGLQARGQRFCIIADCSGSMKGGKIDFLKKEVLRTIGGLSGGTRFQIYFFNNRAVPYPQPGWRRPLVEIAEVRRWVEDTIRAKGGTEPSEAFRLAFQLAPRPDAVFFMTDGKFSGDVVSVIKKLNQNGRRVPVHTITFVDRSAEAMMRQIASQSGGRYRHVAGF